MDFIESRFAILGNVDAGKSTLVGVLTYGIYDNGKGTVRKNVLAFPHEKESGRTSSISTQNLGFDISGQPLYDKEKHPSKHRKNQSISSVAKMLTFIDLAGHEKYLKTTIGGFSGYEMTGSLIVIGANAGGIGTFNEHLGLCEAFSFPYALVFTKIDNCPKKVFENNLKIMVQFLRSNSCNKRPLKVKSLKDVVIAAKNFHSLELVPIFMVSNVTGEGIPLLLTFLNIVKSKNYKNLNNQSSDDENKNPEIIAEVCDKFTVKSLKGVVVQAYVKKGEISLNSVLCIGPNRSGLYAHVEVKEIRRFNLNVNSLKTNQIGTIALRNVGSSKRMEFVAQKETVSRGMFLLNPKFVANNDPIWEFTADIKVRRHPSAIKEGYQAVMHLGHIRSCVRLMKINRHGSKTSADGPEQNDQSESIRYLKAGDSGTVVMHMLYAPAFIQVGSMMLFREQKTKAVGRILSVSSQR
ncbi:MAG: GTP-binding protein 1, partial [Paramarteilia canceri]